MHSEPVVDTPPSDLTDRRALVIEVAKELFWRKGYADASMADIVAGSGLNRYAVYSMFGSKRELFLATLAHYFEDELAQYLPLSTDESVAPLERCRNTMRHSIDRMLERKAGCLLCHVAVDHAHEEPEIGEAVNSYMQRIHECMAVPLGAAMRDGSLNPALSVEQAVTVLFNAELAFGVHARSGAGRELFESIVDATIAALSAAPAPR